MYYFQFHVRDWMCSEARATMKPLERYVYLELLFANYHEGSIPNDAAALAQVANVEAKLFQKAWPAVSRKFPPHPALPDRLANPKALEQLTEYEERRTKASEAAKLRWKKK